MPLPDIVLVSAARTPIGSFLGALSSVPAPRLGAVAIREALARGKVDPASVDQVVFGNVLQAGLGQAPARQAAIYGGVPKAAGAITVHKVCGSGLRAVMDAANGIRAGEWQLVVAGGMESMSNAPHLLERSRQGFRMGEVKLTDSMVKDGLWDPYGDKHMGSCAELCVKKYKMTREEQDAFALTSYKRAQSAIERGLFTEEVAPVPVPQKKGEALSVARDEEPFAAPLEKMPSLKPAFESDGSVTAANASKLNDGAAALVVTSVERARALGLRPLARVVAQASFAQEPEWFTTAPTGAVRLALERAALSVKDIGRWEINEAFAAVAMAAIRDLDLDPATVNSRGGAVALGHPIGASGARILTTLLFTLKQEKQRYGCAAICIGGGEAAAVVIENLA
jgi:acetyl-CoA C-acetyltransferase